jgi:ribosomal-protein-alanine N-acetyltransferase
VITNPFADLKPVETKRLRLRRVRMDDAAALLAYATDPRVVQHTFYSRDMPLSAMRSYLREVIDRYWRDEPGQWAITLHGSDEAIGLVGFGEGSSRHRTGEIGYELHPNYWGQGYATEAVHAVLAYGFERKLYRIEARIFANNSASIAVARRVGLTYEGTHRAAVWVRGKPIDIAIYALLRPDYKRSTPT